LYAGLWAAAALAEAFAWSAIRTPILFAAIFGFLVVLAAKHVARKRNEENG
jgi:hypothetical protein